MKYKIAQKLSLFIIPLVLSGAVFSYTHHAQAQSIDELEQQIKDRAQDRKDLETRAAAIRVELGKVGAEKGSLTTELNRINAERKDLDNTIKQTENEIDTLQLEIKKSETEISRYNSDIKSNSDTLAGILRGVNQRNSLSMLEAIIARVNFSEFFSVRDSYVRLQKPLIELTNTLEDKKLNLRKTQNVLAKEQFELESEKEILGDQRQIIKSKEDEKKIVLNETKKKESSVQKTLNATLQTIAALDAEIRSFESKLKFALNPSSIPQKGTAVFDWPLSSVLITQRFGKTVSSERLYVSGSHSGMDFRAAIGTPVYAVADGVVKGIGNTDDQCLRASFGKWVFIEHDNGLSTTSAHLSSHKVSEGQRIKQGDIIAYSGNSGRSTAPHLHLTVYATKGVNGGQGARVTERPSAACPGSNYRMPLAPTAAYLDPLAYLPKTDASYFKHN